jgi:microcystin-dependent protein
LGNHQMTNREKFSSTRRKAGLLGSAIAVAAGLSALAPAARAGCNADYAYTGEICITAGSYCPEGTMAAAGQTMVPTEYQLLFAVIGNAFGGDGRTSFNLPDLRGRVPVGTGTSPYLTPVQRGQQRGAESVTQSVEQMPPHTHAATFTPNPSNPVTVNTSATTATASKPQDKNYLAEANVAPGRDVNIYAGPSGSSVPLGGVSGGENTGGEVTVATTGGGRPMSTLDPQLGLTYCIVVSGAFPPRP